MDQKKKSGRWMWTPDREETDRQRAVTVYFRKRLQLAERPGSWTVRVTADTRYKFYVNEELVQFGPSRGDLSAWFADSFDLAPFLHAGENVLAVSVLRFPQEGTEGNHGMFRTACPGFYCEEPESGSWRCQTDRGIAYEKEEERFAPLMIHERAVSDPELAGWKTAGYSDDSWPEAARIPEEDLPQVLRPENLMERTIPFMRRTKHAFSLPVTEIPAGSEVSFTLDAGEEMCAYLRLASSGGKGAEVSLLESECYVLPEGKGDRLDAVRGHLEGYTDVFLPSGAEEVYEPYWFRTFRFLAVTVRTAEEPLVLSGLEYEETGYPLDARTEVRTSDPTLVPVWDISLRTLRRCMHETYMDCPFYEQLSYLMDTRSQILYTYAVSADDLLARKTFDDFARGQRPDGLMNCSYPNMNVNVIPGFPVYYILMLHDHMMYFGDRELIRRYLPAAERILQFFAGHLTEQGYVDKVGGVNGEAPFWSFIDWAKEWMPTQGMPPAGLNGPLTMENLLYLLGLQKAAELMDFAGEDGGDALRMRAEALKKALRRHCLDENGMLTDGPGQRGLSQHAQVFGILTGTLTAEEGRKNLLRSLTEEGIARCTVAMCWYLFRALEETGLYEYTDRYWDIWRRMVKNGCTTCVEGEYYPRSECHAWGALALWELPSAVLGVRPASPGCETIAVRPVPGVLTEASGRVLTPKGTLSVSWKKTEAGIDLTVGGAPELLRRVVR